MLESQLLSLPTVMGPMVPLSLSPHLPEDSDHLSEHEHKQMKNAGRCVG